MNLREAEAIKALNIEIDAAKAMRKYSALKDVLPEVARRMAADLQVAGAVPASRSANAVDDQAWVGSHLSALKAPDDV